MYVLVAAVIFFSLRCVAAIAAAAGALPQGELQVPEPPADRISQLTDMGFSETLSRNALLLHRSNVQVALEWLLEHGDNPAAAEPPTQEQLRQVCWHVAVARLHGFACCGWMWQASRAQKQLLPRGRHVLCVERVPCWCLKRAYVHNMTGLHADQHTAVAGTNMSALLPALLPAFTLHRYTAGGGGVALAARPWLACGQRCCCLS